MKFNFSFIDKRQGSVKDDILSGITVALALVPEAVAFAFVAGISPIIGLYGAFMMGIVTAIIGGRPGMISGATGALAVVMVGLIVKGNEMGGDSAGIQYLFATIILAGIIQMAAGFFKLGKFIRMVPQSVMMGFVNGLAIVIFTSQLGMFKVDGEFITGSSMFIMLGLVAFTMAIMYFLPMFSKKIPAALVAIIVVSLIVILGGIETETVRSFVVSRGGSGIKAGLPDFNIPMIPFNMETLGFITPYAIILAMIGLIESLMTLTLVDELTETRGSGNRECVAQGIANITNGFFGGMGGCAMIGQSIINIKSGGRGRLSGIVAALALLAFILFASTYIEMIPIAALVGVMFMVVIGTFAWSTFKIINKIPVADVIVIVLVTTLTVMFDLAIAVAAGVVVAALVFAWENAVKVRVTNNTDDQGVKHYIVHGPLFFASTTSFTSKFDVKKDPKEVVINFEDSRIMDQSAIEAINKLAEKYQLIGTNVHLRYLSHDCVTLIKRAEKICDVNVLKDPDYHVAINDYRKKAEALKA